MFQVNPLPKTRLDILCESSDRQRIHMRHQAFFSSKDKSKKNIHVMLSATILISFLKG